MTLLRTDAEQQLARKDVELSALRQVARNLAQVLELRDGDGIASLRQQLEAHGLQEDA